MRVFCAGADMETNALLTRVADLQARVDALRGYL